MPFGSRRRDEMAIPSAAVPTVDAMIEAAVDQANETFARMFTADDTASFPSSPAFSGSDVGKVSTTVDTTTLLMIGMSVVLVFSLLINVVVIACLLLNRRSSTLPAAPQPPSIQYVVSPPAAPAGRAVDMAEMIRSNATTVRRRPGARSPSPMPMKRSIYAAVPTMEEAAMMQAERNSEVKAKSPRDILEEIKAGNARFWTGESERPDMSLVERRALISGQAPKVMVIGCADSRVPIEIVFDQGIGDVFVVRNAGNLCGDKCAGTIDYAIHHLGIKLVVVMGHQGCGAVKAARLPTKAIMGEPPKLKDMLLEMKRSLSYCSETLDKIQDPNARDREAVIANAQAQVGIILEDPGVLKKVNAGEIMVVAAFYEITSGIVDFIEVSKDMLIKA